MEKEDKEFHKKLDALISKCACYYYPEKTSDLTPDYNKKVLTENSLIKKLIRKKRIKKKFNQFYDVKRLIESYNMFSDEYSKNMFLNVALYRISGQILLRFPIFYSKHFSQFDKYDKMLIDKEEIVLWNDRMHLKKYNLSNMGYDLNLWYTPEGISINYDLEQYRYLNIVKADMSDNVIDCGACYGDTALYFASKSNDGEVYAFEFVPDNIEIFEKNMELNPKYKNKIHLHKYAVSDTSGDNLYFDSNGPATSCSEYSNQDNTIVNTITIDDFAKQNNIQKVDFIKMDIEGFEAQALKGAINTIRRFKPKLAICAYHKNEDLVVLPHLIKSILPEYNLYLDHYTISRTETVIYAKI